eukprot:CAMPEP_0203811900 /NCGR_PEP_ID=MMETSP0115-20131106/3840_1 /ASSEMBLY_ACC=CAM_ASM_000227 /TAXON_ID=33651 /ORGANISM="Bicosoecid sp, Strain ms1" /LENGTH=348 /DNA_ID=CAMNT_0050720737 /DNA_START=116 /DNA_END=1158 /DNA_ORIENTATION=+
MALPVSLRVVVLARVVGDGGSASAPAAGGAEGGAGGGPADMRPGCEADATPPGAMRFVAAGLAPVSLPSIDADRASSFPEAARLAVAAALGVAPSDVAVSDTCVAAWGDANDDEAARVVATAVVFVNAALPASVSSTPLSITLDDLAAACEADGGGGGGGGGGGAAGSDAALVRDVVLPWRSTGRAPPLTRVDDGGRYFLMPGAEPAVGDAARAAAAPLDLVSFVVCTRHAAAGGREEILMVREAKHAGKWFLPAGHVEPRESFTAAAEREGWEESGVVVAPIAATQVVFGRYAGYSPLHVVFRCAAVGGAAKAEADGDTLGAAWLPLDEVLRDVAALAHGGGGGGGG